MPAKRLIATATKPKDRRRAKGRDAYPNRLRKDGKALRERLLREAAANGRRPMSLAEIRAWVDEHRELWPNNGEVDDFISWLRQTRKEGEKR